jgi:predicted DCC family thiol-disulfide oxidoreductase YuxK
MTLVFYDGPCGLCSRAVRWLARRDRRRALAFAPLQGEEGAPYRAAAGMRGEVDVPDTVVVVERTGGAERVTTRAAAVARALRALGGGWALAGALVAAVPPRLANAAYDAVARRRERGCRVR